MIRLDADSRARLRVLEAEKRAMLAPARAEQQAERKANRKPRAQRVTHENAKPDRGREVDKVYRAWVRQFACIAGLIKGGCEGHMEAAHLRFSDHAAGRVNPGMQRKSNDLWVTPLCHHHHQSDQHQRRERDFWADLQVDPNALCIALRAAYDAGEPGDRVIADFARIAA